MGQLILIGGGVRSGKSAWAEARALEYPAPPVYLATGQALDDEMRARIDEHRTQRGDRFETVEAPLDILGALRTLSERVDPPSIVLLDCLTLWISNHLMVERGDDVLPAVDALVRTIERAPFDTLVVTNEVGMGIVPDNALSRRFRDLTGWSHQRLAAAAVEVQLAVMGLQLRVK